jgi:hypothetical protein
MFSIPNFSLDYWNKNLINSNYQILNPYKGKIVSDISFFKSVKIFYRIFNQFVNLMMLFLKINHLF